MTIRITRFAPSPTGYLHIGHAVSAWFAWEQGEKCLLRIEDIDNTRCRPEFVQSIYDDVSWLGLTWPTPVRIQSEHFADYQAALDKLQQMGLLYPCFCTRKDIEQDSLGAPHGPDGILYPGTCRHLDTREREDRQASGHPYALRLDVKKAMAMVGPLMWYDMAQGEQKATPEILGDVVLARKDTPVSYHLCVTHDDALQEINLVTRGEDLFFATHIHRLLQALLGYPVPTYHHHKLLLTTDGRKFSKRHKDLTLVSLRNRGFSAVQLKSMIDDGTYSTLIETTFPR